LIYKTCDNLHACRWTTQETKTTLSFWFFYAFTRQSYHENKHLIYHMGQITFML
jgi:hypothetical protein